MPKLKMSDLIHGLTKPESLVELERTLAPVKSEHDALVKVYEDELETAHRLGLSESGMPYLLACAKAVKLFGEAKCFHREKMKILEDNISGLRRDIEQNAAADKRLK